MKSLIILFLVTSSFVSKAQSEAELVTMLARVCKLDSVDKILGTKVSGDSLKTFSFLTLDYETMGVPVYDFEECRISFDIGSNLLMSGKPYGKLQMGKFTKSKGEITIVIAGAGDRLKEGKWTYATFKFSKPRNGKWLLYDSQYFFTEL
jgi:hypothetical protein